MNKIDKLLYGGFAVVIVAGIGGMLVSVFSPPKQSAEETAKTPKATVEKPIEDVPNQMERWRQGVENARLQREADEALAEHIENDPELAKWIQAEEDAKRAKEEAERAEQEWWENRKDWVERFPFEPTPHPEITFDPTVYDPKKLEEWPEEEKGDDYWEMAMMVDNHSFLKEFYKSKLPYTEEFEQMYDIVKEEIGEEPHPIQLGWIFNTIRDYHKLAQLDPDSVYRKNARVRRPVSEQKPTIIVVKDLPPEAQATYQSLTKQERIKFIAETAAEIQPKNDTFFDHLFEESGGTLADEAESLRESILGELTDPIMPREDDSRLMSMEKATEIRDRLLNEIPAAGFLEGVKGVFAYNEEYEYELKPGDPLLIK